LDRHTSYAYKKDLLEKKGPLYKKKKEREREKKEKRSLASGALRTPTNSISL
jgi:hypothetical protein